ncbi:hypothetical protein NKG94_33970 [Micromonospora sp. M12]
MPALRVRRVQVAAAATQFQPPRESPRSRVAPAGRRSFRTASAAAVPPALLAETVRVTRPPATPTSPGSEVTPTTTSARLGAAEAAPGCCEQ